MRDKTQLGPVVFSKKDIALLQETAFVASNVSSPSQVSSLVSWIMQLVPSEYSACGHFSLAQQDTPGLAHSNYNQEFCQIYMMQGLQVDPAVVQLITTRIGQASSIDDPRVIEPKSVMGLKLDFGIRTCHSFAIRGAGGPSVYLACSNFDRREHARLKTILDMIGPHLFLAYMRGYTKCPGWPTPTRTLTPREHEILKWVHEGKSNWEIAMIFHVSVNTIKFHMKNIMAKLGVENRWAAVAQWQSMTNHLLGSGLLIHSHSKDSSHTPPDQH